jgi:predicted metal-dependent peptidase
MIKNVLKISKELLYEMPFYGSVLLSLQKDISNKVSTAGVGLEGIMYKLIINPDFWTTLSDKHKQGLLLHELGHIINFHLSEYNHLKDKELANIAMDIHINQTIPKDMLPEGGCTWDKYKGLLPNKNTNWYYEKLLNNKNKDNDEALKNCLNAMDKGESEADDGKGNKIQVPQHNWDEVTQASEAVKKMLDKNTESLLRTIVKDLKSQPGTIPNNIEELLDRLNNIEPPKFNWKGFMKRFIGTSTKTWVNKTRRKSSKRFIGMPGSKEYYFSHILVAIDTSASVCQEELYEFQNELHHMHKTGHDIDIILCDTEINDQFKFNPKKPLIIKGRGGTAFQPVIDVYNKNLKKYSCLIYLTDGEAYSPTNTRGNILWVHSSKSEINNELPGKCIQLN